MTMFRSKSSATLRRMLRISSSGKSTERVSLPSASLDLAGDAFPFEMSFTSTSVPEAGTTEAGGVPPDDAWGGV